MLYSFKMQKHTTYQRVVPILKKSVKINFIASNINHFVIFAHTNEEIADEHFKQMLGIHHKDIIIQQWEEIGSAVRKYQQN